jgi:hypothetical protein
VPHVQQNNDKRGRVPCTAGRSNIIITVARHLLYTTILTLLYTHPPDVVHTRVFKTLYTFNTRWYIYTIQTAVSCDTLTRFASSRHFHPFCCWRTLYYIIYKYTHIHTHMHTRTRYPLYAQMK